MIELLARSLRLLVPYRDLYVVAYLEIYLAAMAIRVSTRLFLGLLHDYTGRFPPLMHYSSELSGLVPI